MASPQNTQGLPEVGGGLFNRIGYAIGSAGKAVGKGALYLGVGTAALGGKALYHTAKGIGYGGFYASKKLGYGIGNTASFLAGMGWESLHRTNWSNPVGKLARIGYKAANSMVKYEAGHNVFNVHTNKVEYRPPNLRLTKKGLAVVAIAGIASALSGASAQNTSTNMGMISPNKVTATPQYAPQQQQRNLDGGATGDLVFALHQNRHG